ncbi:hypothetical protein HU200_057703 [Digitaria exilis]|uniref:Uncharacterized protein n=1 Tax=Digitaria exilis TaxID=1010633 RepID=A0A835E0Y1_9POAL|nr:hypothetical protein HU200_057703 [Digitaria exilis]
MRRPYLVMGVGPPRQRETSE